MKWLICALVSLLVSVPAIAQVANGPRFGLDGSIHSPTSSYAINGLNGAASFGAVSVTSGLTDTCAGSQQCATVTDTGGNGANIKLSGNGATTPSKTLRAQNGHFQITNDAYSTVIADIDDSGNLIVPGKITTPGFVSSADKVELSDYCASSSMNGTTDNTTCANAAATYACLTGRAIHVNAIYALVINETWTIPCSGSGIYGDRYGDDATFGHGTVIRSLSGGAAPIIQFTGASGGHGTPFGFGGVVKDLEIESNTGSTPIRTGPYIEMDGLNGPIIDNVFFFAPCTAVRVYGGFRARITNSEGKQSQDNNNCEVIQGVGDTTHTLDVIEIDHSKFDAGVGGSCFAFHDRVQTMWMSNTACETNGQALRIDCPTMTSALSCPGFVTLYDFESEAFGTDTTDDLISITDLVDGFKMTDSWLRGGTVVSGTAYYRDNLISFGGSRFGAQSTLGLPITIANSWFKYANRACLSVTGNKITVTGNHIYGCNYAQTGAPNNAGIVVSSSDGAIIGNTFCGDDLVGDITWPMAGISTANSADYLIVAPNVYQSATGGHTNGCNAGFFNGSGGTHISTTGASVGP